jgi:hypothetical protein
MANELICRSELKFGKPYIYNLHTMTKLTSILIEADGRKETAFLE